MKFGKLLAVVSLLGTAFEAHAGVYVTAPATATVSMAGSASSISPVHFIATATSPACSKGVAAIGIYTAPYVLAYTSNGGSLDTKLALSAGTYNSGVGSLRLVG